VALISVLLIVAVLTAVVYQLLGRHGLSVAQSRNTLGYDQALSYALGGESLARQALFEDFAESGPGVDHLEELWAQAIVPFEIEQEGFLEVRARDLNSCFNLNALAADEGYERQLQRFRALLTTLGIPPTLADVLRDWVDRDDSVHGFGAEDSNYLLQEPAYRSPNGPLAHVSELRLMYGVEPDFPDLLGDTVCLLPVQSLAINVNTASLPLLGSLAENPGAETDISQALADKVRTFTDVDEFLADHPEFGPSAGVLSVTSSWFEVQVRAQVGESTAVLTSILHRNPETGAINVVSRDLGKDFRSPFNVAVEDS